MYSFFVLKASVAWTLPGVASAGNLDIPQLMQLASGTRQGQPPGGTLELSVWCVDVCGVWTASTGLRLREYPSLLF